MPYTKIQYENYMSLPFSDTRYPKKLSGIAGAPKSLWYIGDIGLLSLPCVAIVGARRATEYGLWAARTIAARLSNHGVVVVSGMAEGIDSGAHIGALSGKTPTVAVMGTGIDICYPAHNKKLRSDILKTGLLLSECECGAIPSRYSFPLRNRIISGLADAVVVVEAGLASGSLITAQYAAEQGREVYAVPGNINRRMSIGCNKLIRDGAKPLTFIDDVLIDMGIKTDIHRSIACELGGDEKKVYEAVYRDGEISLDKAAEISGMPVSMIAAIVTILEMKGLVACEQGRIIPLN